MNNSLIGLAMIHTMKYEKFKRYKFDGTPEYYPAQTLKCYKEEKFAKVISANGEEVTSKGRYYTLDKVTALDRIDGYDLINAEHLDFMANYYIAYV